MKNEIIDFVMSTLRFRWIPDWEEKSARNFCKLILDAEGIDYQEEDFNTIGFSGGTKAIEVVKRYAKMYQDIYATSDLEKAMEMGKVLDSCNKMLGFSDALDDIFGDQSSSRQQEDSITIKKGESIRFSNGAVSNLTSEELGNLMSVTFLEDNEEKPFTIHFNASVPEDLRNEVMNRVSTIYEEVKAEMERGKVR